MNKREEAELRRRVTIAERGLRTTRGIAQAASAAAADMRQLVSVVVVNSDALADALIRKAVLTADEIKPVKSDPLPPPPLAAEPPADEVTP